MEHDQQNLTSCRERADATVHRTRPSKPIFIVGPSRSGTELLRAALNGHQQIFIAEETHYFDDLRPRLKGQGVGQLPRDEKRICQDYFLALSDRPYAQGGRAAHARIKREELAEWAEQIAPGGDGYFEAYCWMSRTLEANAAQHPVRWGEKTPRHCFRLPEILVRYPDAQAICLIRDPRAVVASYRDWHHRRFRLTPSTGNAEALETENRRTQASYDPAMLTLMWKAAVNVGERAEKQFGQDRVQMVKYEDLISDPRQRFEEIADWLGVEFQESMIDVPMINSSYDAFDLRAGLSSSPIDRWREKLSTNEIEIVEFCAGSVLIRSGYEPMGEILSPSRVVRMGSALCLSVARAGWANRKRMGQNPLQYISRRATMALRRPT